MAQTHGELELLVVDDGSTDGTRELVEPAMAMNRGSGICFRTTAVWPLRAIMACQAARGDFVALLDSDDIWQPWKIELQLRCLQQFPELGMVWTDMEAIDPSGQVFNPAYIRTMYSAYALFARGELFTDTGHLRDMAPTMADIVGDAQLRMGMIFSQMIMGSLVHTSTVLIRRERLVQVKAFDETLRFSGEDYDFHLRTCRHGAVGLSTCRPSSISAGCPTGSPAMSTASTPRPISCARFRLSSTARDEIHLPQRMIDSALADAHLWIGELRFEADEIAGPSAISG